MVAVVDYGMGNLRSVAQAVMHAAVDSGVNVVITQSAQQVRDADRIVLPGQGAMPDCMRELRESGLLEPVLEAAAKKPLFGVCVGMQMLLDHSAEGDTPGLGLIPGEVVKFDLAGQLQPDGSRYKVPQMGWNQVWQWDHGGVHHPVWGDVPDGSWFYFVHTVFMPDRQMRATAWAKQITAHAFRPPSRVIIFLPPSFTRKKARRRACRSTATSSAGTPEPAHRFPTVSSARGIWPF